MLHCAQKVELINKENYLNYKETFLNDSKKFWETLYEFHESMFQEVPIPYKSQDVNNVIFQYYFWRENIFPISSEEMDHSINNIKLFRDFINGITLLIMLNKEKDSFEIGLINYHYGFDKSGDYYIISNISQRTPGIIMNIYYKIENNKIIFKLPTLVRQDFKEFQKNIVQYYQDSINLYNALKNNESIKSYEDLKNSITLTDRTKDLNKLIEELTVKEYKKIIKEHNEIIPKEVGDKPEYQDQQEPLQIQQQEQQQQKIDEMQQSQLKKQLNDLEKIYEQQLKDQEAGYEEKLQQLIQEKKQQQEVYVQQLKDQEAGYEQKLQEQKEKIINLSFLLFKKEQDLQFQYDKDVFQKKNDLEKEYKKLLTDQLKEKEIDCYKDLLRDKQLLQKEYEKKTYESYEKLKNQYEQQLLQAQQLLQQKIDEMQQLLRDKQLQQEVYVQKLQQQQKKYETSIIAIILMLCFCMTWKYLYPTKIKQRQFGRIEV
jgi:hypothetical protein